MLIDLSKENTINMLLEGLKNAWSILSPTVSIILCAFIIPDLFAKIKGGMVTNSLEAILMKVGLGKRESADMVDKMSVIQNIVSTIKKIRH